MYTINAVMFGMRHALHSAIRSLQECAKSGATEYPVASKVALRDFYVNDKISGADSDSEAITLYHQMTNLLATGGFPLKKWASKGSDVVAAINPSDLRPTKPVSFTEADAYSVLGVTWLPSSDHFTFTVDETSWTDNPTKRSDASNVDKLFVPIGVLTPVTIRGRVFIREIRLEKLDWNATIARVYRCGDDSN